MYYVQFILPDCSIFSPKDQGSDDTIDSDANPIDGKTEVTTLSIDENDATWDAGMFQCMDMVYVDDDYTTSIPGFNIDHFPTLQIALDRLDVDGTAIVYDGIYDEDIVIDDGPCDNTGITIVGEYGCFPIDETAVIQGNAVITVDDVTIKYLEFTPTPDGAITVEDCVSGTTLRCNKFRKDCVADAVGVKSLTSYDVNAGLNWWGSPDGPNGGTMGDGATANGQGVQVKENGGGNVDVEPWIGIHAEIAEPTGTIEVEVGTSVRFDAEGSWAYTYGECCQEAEELPLQYLWDFDDGLQSANKQENHVFDTAGTYHVSLMVDSSGIPGLYSNFMYDWDYVTVHATTLGTPLTASADGENLGGYETIVGEPVQLYGDAYGGNGEYHFTWDFGDNKGTSNEQNPTHVYDAADTYTVTLTVTSGGETATDTAEVVVNDIDELLVDISDGNSIAGVETMFAASVTGGTSPYTYEWIFGDGTTSSEVRPSHTYDAVGEYTVTVTVTDNNDNSKSDSATVTVEEGESSIEPVEIKEVSGGFGVKAVIDSGDNNVDWTITVDGTVFIGGEAEGSIDANVEETVKLPFSLGIGRVDITVTANDVVEERSAFMLGPFVLSVKEV
jgi:PKD repeat protein